MTATSYDLHARTGHTAGNGSLMRTAPVALPYLDDPDALVEAARKVGALTHYDPHAQEACVLWSLAIRHAILHAEFDIRAGLAYLDDEAAAYWTERLDDAEQPRAGSVPARTAGPSPPSRRRGPRSSTRPIPTDGHGVPPPRRQPRAPPSGSATTPTPSPRSPARCSVPAGAPRLSRPSGAGSVTATPACAASGSSSSPTWPPTRGRASTTGRWPTASTTRSTAPPRPWSSTPTTTASGSPTPRRWRSCPTTSPPSSASASSAASRSRPDIQHVGYRLIDHADPAVNPHLDFMLADAARTIAALRDEGHQVVIHCVAAQSRTPTVGVAYAMLRGADRAEALDRGLRRAAGCSPNAGFRAALKRLEKSGIRA